MRSLFFVLLVLWANNLNAQQFMQAANGKRGCVDFDGEILFPFELEESDITTLPPTYSLMILRKNGLYGLFNSKGKVQVPFKYERIEKLEFNDVNPQKAHFTVTQKGKKGIIDENNHTILPTKFDTIFLHSGYLLALKKRDSIFHAYNLSGKLLFKFAGNISKKYPPLMNYVYVTTPTNSEAIYSDNGLIEVTNKLPSGNCMVQYNIKSPDSLHKKPKLIHGEWAMPCEYTIIKAGVSGQFIVQ